MITRKPRAFKELHPAPAHGIIPPMQTHEHYMALAIEAARAAQALGDVPIGCIIVHDDQVIATSHNRRELDQDPLAHAEVLALRAAAAALGSWRLENTTLYVTLEPCPMCAGAIILSRVAHVVYGATDPKAGCCGTLMNLLEDTRFNHQPELISGILAQECGALLTNFFREVRAKKRATNS
jgi:tRNA(adenine34) deaminase